MDRATLRHTLTELYNADTGNSLSTLGDAVRLVDDLGLDSVDMVSLIMQVERRFRIRLSHEELSAVLTAGDLLDLIATKSEAECILRAA
ncbi:MAG: acpP 5 [Planctomycetaceae bacterium]|nr:acpP 5 [Planctomycetaceae bacterium]